LTEQALLAFWQVKIDIKMTKTIFSLSLSSLKNFDA
jgi:hypothetical protein